MRGTETVTPAWLKELKEKAPGLLIRENVMMKNHTTFRIGGPAEYLIEPVSEQELSLVRQAAAQNGLPFFLMGNGSNLLVLDGGIPGITVRLGKGFSAFGQTGPAGFWAQAGALLSEAARKAQQEGLSGLAFAAGIPGTVGGGLYMNAGAYGGEMAQVVTGADAVSPSGPAHLNREELRLSYRHSALMEKPELMVTKVYFDLQPGDPEEIKRQMEDLQARRREKQPLTLPSAGSFFKRPQGDYAARLIEAAGLKGFRVGDAAVSEKHAGFVVNLGEATARQVLELMRRVQERVYQASGILLEPEVKMVGVDG